MPINVEWAATLIIAEAIGNGESHVSGDTIPVPVLRITGEILEIGDSGRAEKTGDAQLAFLLPRHILDELIPMVTEMGRES